MKEIKLKQMNGQNALVIGGLGFLGSNLCHKLVGLGAKVTILDACIKPYGANKFNIKEIMDKVVFVKGDIRNFELMKKQVKGKDLIFDFAAQVGRRISMQQPFLDLSINCEGTLKLLEACRQFNDKTKILYAGTRGEIGEPVYCPVDENHPTNPTDIYGVNKLAAEKYCLLYNKVYGLKSVSLRLNNVFGPRCQMHQGFYGVLNWFIRNCLMDETITVYGKGNQTRDYVFVDDVVKAFLLASQSKKADGEVFFVGSGREIRFIDMVKEVIKAVGKGKYVHVPFPDDITKIDIKRFVSSYEKINKALRWRPETSFEEGVKLTTDFYKKHLKHYL